MKKINITTAILLLYLLAISVIGWPGKNPQNGYTEYLIIMGTSLIVIFILRFVQIKRFNARQELKDKQERKED